MIYQYVPFPKFEWNSNGNIINCSSYNCDNETHKINGVDYYGCNKLPKVNWCASSFTTFIINLKHECLSLCMFHDYNWRDTSLKNHLSNDNIFISYPLHVKYFFDSHAIPDYSIHKSELKTCFNDILFLFPRGAHDLYWMDWDMQTVYYDLKPLQENWNNCLNIVGQRLCQQLTKIGIQLKTELDNVDRKLQKCKSDANVCYPCLCYGVFVFIFLHHFFVLNVCNVFLFLVYSDM